ncbi:hypothetical protein KPL70_018096 [Citrus sinensis]|uniref:PRC-barrel domain-containing protein n=1 Tax=Citrus clementina TaxID=85681 RepID=V4SV10_CITCL|nr:hypothetical protein CICLE_v10012138mg [Citrus x clementina]KAH9673406.1 hypothetical protein KPL70_018096 [Citrus sinensis]
MGLEVRVSRMSECISSIPLYNSVPVTKIRTLSGSKWRPKNGSVRNGNLQYAMCTFKPPSKNQELFDELGFKDKFSVNSAEENSREIAEVKEEKREEEKDGSDGSSEKVKLRRGGQVMRRSNLLAKQVISIQSAMSLGFVSQLWVDTTSWVVLVVEVRPNLLSGEPERLLLEDICQVGDVVLIEDESVMENDFKMVGLDTLVGYRVVTPGRQNIGKVRGYTFNINSGAVESLELDSFGISIIPSSLVSTYALLVEDVLEVVADIVVVHEAAASRVQRLTKVPLIHGEGGCHALSQI